MNALKSLGGHQVVIGSIPFSIEEKRVLRELRIPRIKSVSEIPEEGVAKAIKQAIDTAYTLIHGRGCYRTLRIMGTRADRVLVEGSESLFVGRNMARLLARCDHATLLATTIGPELERKVDHIKKTQTADAYFLDAVGGWMADYMADRVDSIIQNEIARCGYARTMRYSPGYGDWDVAEQRRLFRLCPGTRAGVALNEACVMTPGKSISLLAGAGRAARVDHYFSQCARCWMPACAYRRAPARRTVHR